MLYPKADNKISDLDYKDSVSLAIGPEGDFTKYEVDSLTEKGFIPVTIGKRILRAETAAISAISSVRFSAKEFWLYIDLVYEVRCSNGSNRIH